MGRWNQRQPYGVRTSGCFPVPTALCLIFTLCTAVIHSPDVFLQCAVTAYTGLFFPSKSNNATSITVHLLCRCSHVRINTTIPVEYLLHSRHHQSTTCTSVGYEHMSVPNNNYHVMSLWQENACRAKQT